MWTAFLVAASSFHAASPIASLCEHLAKAPQECMTPARVLVLGDADFSHSCALVTALCCCPDQDVHLWTSCFESEDELLRKYPDAASNVVSLRSESRVQELSFGVDGRNIGIMAGIFYSTRSSSTCRRLPWSPDLATRSSAIDSC
jgi:hypothetical protein